MQDFLGQSHADFRKLMSNANQLSLWDIKKTFIGNFFSLLTMSGRERNSQVSVRQRDTFPHLYFFKIEHLAKVVPSNTNLI